jgi:hypothetical protein
METYGDTLETSWKHMGNFWATVSICPVSFRPGRVRFHPRIRSGAGYGCVNLQVFLCAVRLYASAQTLDFLALTKNARFPIWRLQVTWVEVYGWTLLCIFQRARETEHSGVNRAARCSFLNLAKLLKSVP